VTGIQPTINCPCGEMHRHGVFTYVAPPEGETRFDLRGQSYQRSYDRCEICGHFFGRHALDLNALYCGDYVDSTYGGIDGMQERLQRILALPPEHSDNIGRVRRVADFAADQFCLSRRLLDVGAGIGVFPAAMKAQGWRVTAIEPDLRTVKHLCVNVEIEAYAENLLDLTPERLGHFDAVSFNKVLEHVEQPVELLTKGASFLTEGGFIYIELPDAAAADEGQEREEFFVEHHHVFSPVSFAMLAQRAGLSLARLDRMREPSGKFTLAGFLRKVPATAGVTP
jgi:SAM-dependent methyltransferase